MCSSDLLAVDEGNWHYLWDKAHQLEDAAGRLRAIAEENWTQVRDGGTRPRKDAVAAAVAHYGRHYRAGRLLHPEAGDAWGAPIHHGGAC